MRIAIMQPYVFPYIGYFQLIRAVDLFVFYNDVNFIKKGWIHRNRILLNREEFLFTIPCASISQNKRICDTRLAFDSSSKQRFLANINHAYKRARFFDEVYLLINKIINAEMEYIDEFAIKSVTEICKFLSLATEFTVSREKYCNEELKKADRLIDICMKENILNYVNAIGGQDIYSKDQFLQQGVNLQFLKPVVVSYSQFGDQFVPWLSMIDVLMFNSKPEVIHMLDSYKLE